MSAPTRITAAFDPARPYAVVHGHIVEGVDLRTMSTHCCERAARDEATTLRAMGRFNVEVLSLRAVPTRGANGGWRVAPASEPHRCTLADRVDPDE